MPALLLLAEPPPPWTSPRLVAPTIGDKIEHTGLGNLVSSCAGPNHDEMWACQLV
uniref:Uncharacterized protein n=1 Tax=Oryza sativa subsp. japonica TaxID=39947 RepID=Q69LX7_ORYSJ|nr:hypothetical protein [Oryza sativa Japonica Group]